MAKHRPSLSDVAKLANVSVSTVSYVINNRKHKYSEATRQRVMAAVKKLDYRPHAVARNLVTQQTETFGLLFIRPEASRTSYFEPVNSLLVGGIADACAHLNRQLLLFTVEQPKSSAEWIRFLDSSRMDGALVFGAIDEESCTIISKQELPVLFVDVSRTVSVPSIRGDNFDGTMTAIKHLCELGHQRIAYLAGDLRFGAGKDRLEGYLAATNQYGVDEDPKLVMRGDFTEESGYRLTEKLLETMDFTAILAANDYMAIGALKALRKRGIRVPRDISLVGFDDVPLSAYTEPPLTTVAHPLYELGFKAAKLLYEVTTESLGIEAVNQTLPTTLLVRQSSGPIHGMSASNGN